MGWPRVTNFLVCCCQLLARQGVTPLCSSARPLAANLPPLAPSAGMDQAISTAVARPVHLVGAETTLHAFFSSRCQAWSRQPVRRVGLAAAPRLRPQEIHCSISLYFRNIGSDFSSLGAGTLLKGVCTCGYLLAVCSRGVGRLERLPTGIGRDWASGNHTHRRILAHLLHQLHPHVGHMHPWNSMVNLKNGSDACKALAGDGAGLGSLRCECLQYQRRRSVGFYCIL